jgi:chromosome segregation ATPase
MEVFLIVLLFAFLIYIKNSLDSKLDRLNSRFDRIESKFREWDKKLDYLKSTEKTAEKTPEAPEKIISIPDLNYF